jgi:sugar porter (SP) family MFS transporter
MTHAPTTPLPTAPGLQQPARLRGSVLRSALVAALGALLFGFDTAVISGTTEWLKSGFVAQITGQLQSVFPSFVTPSFMLGFTVTSALIGTVLGSLAAGRLADVLGRHGILYLLAILFFVSALGCALAWGWWPFVFFRFVGGLAVGAASVVSPLYIAEISPARFRGRLVAITQFNIVFGILLAYLSNYVIASMNLGASECRWMYGVMTLPAMAFFFLLFGTPQSPRWLLARGRIEEARAVLEQCGTDSGNVEEEIRDIQASLDLGHHTLEEPFYCRKYARLMWLAVAIAIFNQLSGINAIIYYTGYIFKMAGADAVSALGQSVIVGLVLLLSTFAPLTLIDHFGRRKLMVAGSIGYIASLGAAAYAFATHTQGKMLLLCLLVFIVSHSVGQGSVIWVFISEIFPNRVRARGQSLGCFTHWAMAAAITWTFPVITEKFGGGAVFSFYAVCMVGQLLWVLFIMPETKGISLEQIQKQMGIE